MPMLLTAKDSDAAESASAVSLLELPELVGLLELPVVLLESSST